MKNKSENQVRVPSNPAPGLFPRLASLRRHFWLAPTTLLLGLALLALQGGMPAHPALAAAAAPAAPTPDAATTEFFETKVRPVLASQCYSCHGPDAQQGGLRVDLRAAILKGGKSGPALVPGDTGGSLLIKAVAQTGALKMPLGGHLKEAEIAALTAWVKMGAPWPDAVPTASLASDAGGYIISPQQRKFWSFQPVKAYAPPAVKNAAWVRTPIDRFILAKLESHGLRPAPPIDKRALIRRATFDLTGLPPTPAESDAFVKDKSPDAFAHVVDRLLASPHYGECWARHWLDVARYADTKGYVFNEDRNYPNAYTYRDWVINAFNTDMPYDEFIREQIAADRLPGVEKDPRALAALGFLTVGRRFLNQEPDIVNDRIDVTMRGFEGLTVSCARCHDHKFDPIPTKDYYSLYGIFAASRETSPPLVPAAQSAAYTAYQKQMADLTGQEQQTVLAQVAALRDRDKQPGSALPPAAREALQLTGEGARPDPDRLAKLEPLFAPDALAKLAALRQQTAALGKSAPATPPMAMALEDAPRPGPQHIFKRGNPDSPGDEAPPRFLLALAHGPRPIWTQDSGRLELAQAITAKTNPLTARVFVNRVWMYHFGYGLVRTPSDFGKQGERPSHPELLDYLASRFMVQGWSVKKLQRIIMLSAAYQQSDENPSPKVTLLDPENRLLSHQNRRRLEFEAMRDALLSASGKLDDRTVGGPSVDIWARPYPTRRSLYGFIDRQNLPGVFRTFDLASPDTTSPKRFVTTVPQQALFFLNSPFVAEQAHALAARPGFLALDGPHRVRALYLRLYGREPSAEEVSMGLDYVHSMPPADLQAETPLWQYGFGRYDEASKRLTGFTPFPKFDNGIWHGAGGLPDPVIRFCSLNAIGGHPGGDAAHATVRRWNAPQAGTVRIQGTLNHPDEHGDGVRARIVSSRAGLLGEWTAHHSQTATEVASVSVEKGDTLDFVVDCRDNDGYDSFAWSPTLILLNGRTTWSAQGQFSGPGERFQPMTAWESYVQALLMANEFVYVD